MQRRVLVALRPVSPLERLFSVGAALSRRMDAELEILADPAHPNWPDIKTHLDALGGDLGCRLTPVPGLDVSPHTPGLTTATVKGRWRPRPHLITVDTMLLAVLAALAAAAPAPFTLDQVMSAPFPTGLVAAQGHPKLAWVMNARGARNVWVAEGPEYHGRAVTAFGEDDGEDIADLAFTADALSVVFVRGGAPNRAGETPNPWSRTEPRERAVHVVSLAGAARRLAEGHSPLPYPRENRIAFVDKNQVCPPSGRGIEAGTALRRAGGVGLAALLRRRGLAGVRE